VLPAYRDNPDRGVSRIKAASPEEAAHRRQTWNLARGEWETARADLADPQARAEAWAGAQLAGRGGVCVGCSGEGDPHG